MTRPEVDWHELRTVAPGRRSPLSALTPTPEGRDTVLMTGIARIAGVGRATVANWRRRHTDFPTPTGGTATHPEFDRPAAVAWLLAHDKITVPSGVPSATLVLRAHGTGRGLRCRLDAPWLQLAADAADDDRMSGWMSDEDADALAALTAEGEGAAVRRLAAPGTVPLTVLGGARVIEGSRRGGGALRVTVSWPGALRGHLAPGRAARSATACRTLPPARNAGARAGAAAAQSPRPTAPSTGPRWKPVMAWHPGGGGHPVRRAAWALKRPDRGEAAAHGLSLRRKAAGVLSPPKRVAGAPANQKPHKEDTPQPIGKPAPQRSIHEEPAKTQLPNADRQACLGLTTSNGVLVWVMVRSVGGAWRRELL